MSGPSWLAIGTGVLLDGGLKATVLVAAVIGIGAVLRHESASTRHGVYTATLLSLPLLPLVALSRGFEVAVDRPEVLGIWLLGVLVAVMPLIVGRMGLGRAWSAAKTSQFGPDVRLSRHIHTPLTFGWWHPRILLPESSLGWTAQRRNAVLAHERAHVARRDWLVHALAWTVCAMFWFHPGAWYIRRLVMREAEHAADDAALARGTTAPDYAQVLVDLARARPPAAALAHSPSDLERRVRAVLQPRARLGRGARPFVLLLAMIAITTPALAAWPAWSAPPEAQTCQPLPGPVVLP